MLGKSFTDCWLAFCRNKKLPSTKSAPMKKMKITDVEVVKLYQLTSRLFLTPLDENLDLEKRKVETAAATADIWVVVVHVIF